MIDINKLFSTDKKDAIKFYNEEHDLTPEQREELHKFFEGTYKTTLVAKSFMGIAAGLTMVWLARRKRRISPLYAMFGGIGLSAFVFSYMTPTIYQNKINDLERKFGTDSKEYKVIQVTPNGAEYSYYWSEYFNNSILDKTVRLQDPTKTFSVDDKQVQFIDTPVPFGHRTTDDHLIENTNPVEKNGSTWESVREKELLEENKK